MSVLLAFSQRWVACFGRVFVFMLAGFGLFGFAATGQAADSDVSYTISTIAGNGIYGYSPDGVEATAAKLGDLQGIAVDGDGNLYYADA